MPLKIDLNCDMGEGMMHDKAIMSFISSANIACGYHAGNDEIIRESIRYCGEYKVAIGAHPGFDDQLNFGRIEIQISPEELYTLFSRQVRIIKEAAENAGLFLHHVKPHGALYNMAARDKIYAAILAKATKDIDPGLILYGLSGSEMIHAAKALQLRTASEVFADRSYEADGSLTPRSKKDAVLTDEQTVLAKALQMVEDGLVKSTTGEMISVKADTICIHGDTLHAVEFANIIFKHLRKNGITIETI